MKIGYLGKQNSFAVEMLNRLRAARIQDELLPWSPDEEAPAQDLEVIISVGKVGAEKLDHQPKLALLQTATAGFESVDVEELAWTRQPGTQRQEHPEANRALYGKTICIVGLGGIGDLLIERLRGFGVTLTGVDSHPEHAPAGVKASPIDGLKDALASADYVVLAVPGTKENENLMDAAALASMKKDAVLVNVGRGTLIDEKALLAAVRSGRLYGAGLDVVRDEPVTSDNALLSEPRILVTPHVAGSTDLMLQGTVDFLTETLARFEQGLRPEGVVNEPKQPRVPLNS